MGVFFFHRINLIKVGCRSKEEHERMGDNETENYKELKREKLYSVKESPRRAE